MHGIRLSPLATHFWRPGPLADDRCGVGAYMIDSETSKEDSMRFKVRLHQVVEVETQDGSIAADE